MKREIVAKLLDDVLEESYNGLQSLAVIGRAADVRQFAAALRAQLGFRGELELFGTDLADPESGDDVRPYVSLAEMCSSTVAIVDDEDKEATLALLLEHASARATPKVLLAGYGHYAFRDQKFQAIIESLLVPSIANGYPNCLVHIYQCLEHAAVLGLEGCVAEFGVFKGGTTRFIAEVITSLEREWPIYGFDTFGGFPSRRSLLDMYDHEGAEYSRFPLVEQYLSDTKVELVRGDIVETASILRARPMILTFVDTDNYSAAHAAIEAVVDNTVIGGAIVLGDRGCASNRLRAQEPITECITTCGQRVSSSPARQRISLGPRASPEHLRARPLSPTDTLSTCGRSRAGTAGGRDGVTKREETPTARWSRVLPLISRPRSPRLCE